MKPQMSGAGGYGKGDRQLSPGADGKSEIAEELIPLPPIVIDSELVAEVNSITSQMAAATAAGKEMTLTQAQQLTLQKHQLLVQQQKTQQQQAQQQMQANPLLAKKFPNYRLLGRNIFEGNKQQPFQKKRVKVGAAFLTHTHTIKFSYTRHFELGFVGFWVWTRRLYPKNVWVWVLG